jgi:uncharacterized protein YfeS
MKVHLLHTTKFWNIRVGTDEFVVQYGKLGTVGKVQLKSFDTAEECKKEADKLVRQKLKKGYVEVEYDWDNHLYLDDPEVGPHPLTANPAFMQHFQEDFYLDCTDEYAPFGSDEGADVLDMFGEALRKEQDFDFLEGAYSVLSDWLEEDISTPDDWMLNGDRFVCDVVILASAFASIKLTGRITDALKRSAHEALTTIVEEVEPEDTHRFQLINEQLATFPVSK